MVERRLKCWEGMFNYQHLDNSQERSASLDERINSGIESTGIN
jgi:hypothetical protein